MLIIGDLFNGTYRNHVVLVKASPPKSGKTANIYKSNGRVDYAEGWLQVQLDHNADARSKAH